MSLSAEERYKRVQRRQGTPGRRVLNSGWRVRSAVMLPPNVDVAESWHQTRVESCWPGMEPYRVGSDIPARKACIQSSQGHATNEAARAAVEWYGRIDIPRGWNEPWRWWLLEVCWVMTTVDPIGLSCNSRRGSALDWPRDRSTSPASVRGDWKCGSGKCDTGKIVRAENAGVEKAGVDSRGGKCRSKSCGIPTRDYIEKTSSYFVGLVLILLTE